MLLTESTWPRKVTIHTPLQANNITNETGDKIGDELSMGWREGGGESFLLVGVPQFGSVVHGA